MATNQIVIGAAAIYIGTKFGQHTGRKLSIREVHRFDRPEAEIGPYTAPDVVIKSECTLRRLGGLKLTDRLVIAPLDAQGWAMSDLAYRVSQGEIEFASWVD
jgi:hypothetical protein